MKLPKGKRWEFILTSKVWLARPPQILLEGCQDRRGNPTIYNSGYYDPPYIPLRGDHDNMKTRRRYRVHPEGAAYIADYKPELNGGYEVIEGMDIVAAVLGGDLDLMTCKRSSKLHSRPLLPF